MTLAPNVRGALWIVCSAACFATMALCLKGAGQTLPVWEVIALRTVFAVMMLSPLFYRTGPRVLYTRHWRAHVVRSLLGLGGLTSLYFAVTHLDLALATALSFARNLFVIVLAVIFIGEIIRWRRSIATVVGFVGVLICLQPGTETFDPWTLAALTGALFGAGVTTAVKRLAATDGTLTIVIYTHLLMGLMTLVPAIIVWRTPNATELLLVVLIALMNILGQSCMIRGLRIGEVTAVTPFEYSRLLIAALLGFVFFGEVASSSTWLGASVIIASTVYIAVREAQLARSKSRDSD